MGTSRAYLTGLKIGSPRELEQAFIDVHGRIDSVHNTLLALRQQVANLPTAAQLQQHTATIEKAISTNAAFDSTVAGITSSHKIQGSILPIVVGKLAYTSNGTSITWFWDGTNGSSLLLLLWPDGSQTQVPPASLAITALAGSTTYIFYPYFDTVYGGIGFAAVAGGLGTPGVAYAASSTLAAAVTSLDTHAPISAVPLTAATTGGGAGGGSGGGSGGGCVSEGTEIVALAGDALIYTMPCEEWLEVSTLAGHRLRAVPQHRILSEEGFVELRRLRRGAGIVTLDGISPH